MMDDELKRDPLSEPARSEPDQAAPHRTEYAQTQERVFARIQPSSEMEERLAERIAFCRYTLDQIQNRLTKSWSQLNKVQEALKHDPLP